MANSEGGSVSSGEESELDSRVQDLEMPEKKKKPGIIYLSSVPEGMNVSETTSFFAEFGRLGRVFLQPDSKMGMRHFTEGWIEFLSKKVAKRVAEQINNTPVGGKRKNKAHYTLWNIKYLPRFKWVHLSERLAYEKAVKQQRMRTEISQVKREAEQFKSSVRQQKKKKRKRAEEDTNVSNNHSDLPTEDRLFFFKQEETYSAKRRKREEEEAKHNEADKEKSKKSKKEKKSKEKKDLSPPISKLKKDKKVGKKKKKESGKKSEDDSSNRKHSESLRQRRKSSDDPPTSHVKKTDAASRKRAEGAIRRKSGEGDRAAFLKSVFGGGT